MEIDNFIIPCGTSQLDRKKLDRIGLTEQEIDILTQKAKNTIPGTNFDEELRRLKNRIVKSLVEKINRFFDVVGTENNPFGAEFNTIYMIRDNYTRGNVIKCSILSSDTGEGYFCAIVLKNLLIQLCNIDSENISILVVGGLNEDPGNQNEIETLMDNLLLKISGSLCPDQEHNVKNVIIMTGGFKSLIPCLTLIATLFGLEMAYVFELSRHIQKITPMINFQDKDIRHKWIDNWNDVMKQGKVAPGSWLNRLITLRNEHKDEVYCV